jgi:myosin-1
MPSREAAGTRPSRQQYSRFKDCQIQDGASQAGTKGAPRLETLDATRADAPQFVTELQIHSKLSHPNIVEFYRAFSFETSTYVVLELCENGSLADAIKKRKYFTMPEIRRFMIQTCGAIKYLHQRNIVHRDLKTGNLFLDRDMNVKVGDFGLAALLVSQSDYGAIRRTTMCGTPNYLAPEVLEKTGKGHDEKVDIWAIGIMM